MPLIEPAFSGSFGLSAPSARNSSTVADQPGAERGLALVAPAALAEMALEHGASTRSARRARQAAAATRSASSLWSAPRGASSARSAPARAANSWALSSLSSRLCARRPCRVAFCAERALPAALTGPRERAPLRRLAAAPGGGGGHRRSLSRLVALARTVARNRKTSNIRLERAVAGATQGRDVPDDTRVRAGSGNAGTRPAYENNTTYGWRVERRRATTGFRWSGLQEAFFVPGDNAFRAPGS
jgi:hypothetical protein